MDVKFKDTFWKSWYSCPWIKDIRAFSLVQTHSPTRPSNLECTWFHPRFKNEHYFYICTSCEKWHSAVRVVVYFKPVQPGLFLRLASIWWQDTHWRYPTEITLRKEALWLRYYFVGVIFTQPLTAWVWVPVRARTFSIPAYLECIGGSTHTS